MATTSNPLAAQIYELQRYTACDIADTLLNLKVPNAGYIPDLSIRAPGPARISGHVTIAPASTVLMVAKNGSGLSELPESNIPSDKYWVDLTQPDTIVVMKQAEGQICAVLGGIMASRMSVLKAKGVVVDGRVRDMDQLPDSGLLIWSKGTSAVGTGLEAKPHAVQIPLDIGGTVVTPGDLVFCDDINGVVVIPQDKVTEVLYLLPRMTAADEKIEAEVASGAPVIEALARHRPKKW